MSLFLETILKGRPFRDSISCCSLNSSKPIFQINGNKISSINKFNVFGRFSNVTVSWETFFSSEYLLSTSCFLIFQTPFDNFNLKHLFLVNSAEVNSCERVEHWKVFHPFHFNRLIVIIKFNFLNSNVSNYLNYKKRI